MGEEIILKLDEEKAHMQCYETAVAMHEQMKLAMLLGALANKLPWSYYSLVGISSRFVLQD